MLPFTRLVVAVFSGFFALTPCLRAEAPRTVILRNGQILEGQVSQIEEVLGVDLGDGQIRLKKSEVELVCDDLDDGYRRKRAAIRAGNVHQHLELAQWCLRHGLLGPAAVELADAMAADPTHPMLGAVQHRLKMALQPPQPNGDALPRQGPTNEELDRMVQGLPRGTIESFTQTVQPVLMNRCASGGCHGPQSDSNLKIWRVTANKQPTRRVTQRNLYAIMQYVDRENPMESPLLKSLSGPHGGTKGGVMAQHEIGQIKRLVDWTNQVAQRRSPEIIATIEPAEAAPKELAPEARKAKPLAVGRRASAAQRGAVPVSHETPADAPE